MDPEAYLLDTSALLTLIQDEEGAARVQEILEGSHVLIPWLALLEVYYITRRKRGAAEADRRYALICRLPATILWEVTEPLLLTAARLKATHRLSLADAIIAATALQHKATLVHKDPELDPLAPEIPQELLRPP